MSRFMSNIERSRLSPEQFLISFRGERQAAMDEDLKTAASRLNARRFFQRSLTEHSNHWYGYRILAAEFDIEEDLRSKLDAYKPLDKHDAYKIEIHDLKLLRRIALRRYAFGLANEIAGRLADRGAGRAWLFKDRLLPRVPLALAVGYGIVLGSFREWLILLGAKSWFAAGLAAVTLPLSWFLIYGNVRDRIGKGAKVAGRAWRVFLISVAWSLFFLGIARVLAMTDAGLNGAFDYGAAISLGCSSLLVAITVQFFFAKAGSIADPL